MGRLGSSDTLQRSKALALRAMHFFLDQPYDVPGQPMTRDMMRTVIELVAALREADMAESDEQFGAWMGEARDAARVTMGALSMLQGDRPDAVEEIRAMHANAGRLRDNCDQFLSGSRRWSALDDSRGS
ncbi:MAG TPA: hypothetical protein VFJ30_00310 [Phycisphaerae bacterium]|nr:hypothetical protein [Phycisphaerae bacterium]